MLGYRIKKDRLSYVIPYHAFLGILIPVFPDWQYCVSLVWLLVPN
jgi:hypothetical protein